MRHPAAVMCGRLCGMGAASTRRSSCWQASHELGAYSYQPVGILPHHKMLAFADRVSDVAEHQ